MYGRNFSNRGNHSNDIKCKKNRLVDRPRLADRAREITQKARKTMVEKFEDKIFESAAEGKGEIRVFCNNENYLKFMMNYNQYKYEFEQEGFEVFTDISKVIHIKWSDPDDPKNNNF